MLHRGVKRSACNPILHSSNEGFLHTKCGRVLHRKAESIFIGVSYVLSENVACV
jgi:hypothetical protein